MNNTLIILIIVFLKSVNATDTVEYCADKLGVINEITERCDCIYLKVWVSSLFQILLLPIAGGYWYNGWWIAASIHTGLTILFCIMMCCGIVKDANNNRNVTLLSVCGFGLFKLLSFAGFIGFIIILVNQNITGYNCYLS